MLVSLMVVVMVLASAGGSAFLWGTLTLNLIWIGLLPRIFFKSGGRLTLRWWLTALPLFMLGAVSLVGLLAPGTLEAMGWVWTGDHPFKPLSMVAYAASMAGMAWTMKTHTRPVALWHQPSDMPSALVTHGPYRWVRHPFYSCFLLTEFGACLMAPGPLTFILWAVGIVVLTWTARGEEAQWLGSPHGGAYRAYAAVTGRFIPRFFGRRAAHGDVCQ